MKHLKTLGYAAITACVLMAFPGAGTASATTLDCGASMCAAETVIHATGTNVTLHAAIGDITCTGSTVLAKTTNTGGSTETINGHVEILTWSGCNTEAIETLFGGELIIHTDANDTGGTSGNGTLTSVGAAWTVKFLGLHCIFGTNNVTDMGTITGSTATGGKAVWMVEARIERIGGRSGIFCGGTSELTGTYSIDNPMSLNVT